MPYPYTFPNIPPRSVEFVARSTVRTFTSPFTGTSQTVNYNAAQWWELNLQFPPLFDDQARTLSGFINSLQGQHGTFYFTLPSYLRISGEVVATVASNGNELSNVGTGSAQPGLFGCSLTEPRRLVQFTTATSVFPALTPNSVVTLHPTTGSLYRLASNDVSFTADYMHEYGVSLPIVEAKG